MILVLGKGAAMVSTVFRSPRIEEMIGHASCLILVDCQYIPSQPVTRSTLEPRAKVDPEEELFACAGGD